MENHTAFLRAVRKTTWFRTIRQNRRAFWGSHTLHGPPSGSPRHRHVLPDSSSCMFVGHRMPIKGRTATVRFLVSLGAQNRIVIMNEAGPRCRNP